MNASTLFSLFFITTFFLSCEKEPTVAPDETTVAFEEAKNSFNANVSVFDVRARTVNETSYAHEIYLLSFADYKITEDGFILSDMLYKDDGQDLDIVAGDGLYTAATLREFSEDVPFIKDIKIRSLLEKPIISDGFSYETELRETLEIYPLRTSSLAKADVTIKCKVKITECPNEHWWDTSWFGEPCLSISDCSITIR